MILTPILSEGPDGTPVTISLTLVQEPTEPLTLEPASAQTVLTAGGPQIRIPVTINAGNNNEWRVAPFRFDADDIDAITSEPTEGVGTQDIEIIINQTPSLVSTSLELSVGDTIGQVNFEDVDALSNFIAFDIINGSLSTTQ